MPLNIESKTSYYQFDSTGMLIVPGDDLSWRDSVGRSVLAWIAYGKPVSLFMNIEECWDYKRNILYRHPKYTETASRDHYSYFTILQKLERPDNFYKYVLAVKSMRGMNNWMKALTGDKRAEKRYYFWAIPSARFGNWWLKVCRRVGKIGPEWSNIAWIWAPLSSNTTVGTSMLKYDRTKWQKLWGWIILNTIPAFVLHIKAWQLRIMPESEKKKKLQKILLRRVAKRNVLVRLVLGDDTVTREEVDNMPHMTGYPSGVYLDESCRRNIREMTEQEREFNSYEVDLIKYLWYTGGYEGAAANLKG
jgi:hypothetical protein